MRMTSTLALAGLLTALNLGAAQAYSMDPLTRRAYAPVTRQAEAKPQAAVSAPVTSPSQSTGTEVPAIRREVVSFSGNYEPGTIVVSTSERRMYLGSSLYRIHGSNEPETIGQAVSSGCIRMANEDVIDLYERVNVGATVIVQR